ncbi:HTH-type transcriptional activator IlvY [Agaribacterium haliotis]|uniref:HTH-type transcriptional activator IlvY n=1 Tax=Agaribacterium haliotis TaxID=2013869 RepID=UPI000BB54AF0|nr:HTH-type transcriptional activator IlvY [Agaribacterium haliotis]
MNQEKLKLFIKLAETGSFNRCAQQQHISASKLSRVIQSMEEELGTTLFERDNRHVALSAEGERFLSFAREQLQHWETYREDLRSRSGQLSGSVSIYCSVTASYSFLYDMLARFREEQPLIQIKLHTGDPADAIERVSQGLEDIAIAAKLPRFPPGLSFKQFDSSPLIFICAADDTHFNELAKNNSRRSWAQLPMIVSERGLARERFNQWVQQKGFTPNIYSQVSGNEAIVSMVSLGCGVGLIPKIVVENSPLKNKVKEFSVQPDIAPYDVGACVQSRRLKSPLVSALWQLIK